MTVLTVSIILSPFFNQRDKNQGVGLLGGMYIGSLWLTMLICVVLGALGVLKWLDALYYISFITLVTTVVKYIPLVRCIACIP